MSLLPPKLKKGAGLIWTKEDREHREYRQKSNDQRNEFERDRDRIHYSSAFHRLAGVTQVVRAGEAEYFHTRQQHTLKVAQLGRRLAQRCLDKQTALATEWGIHPEVVEAACLAHDLGHPPFGHIGEHTLDHLTRTYGCDEGYEGNAQSFRIICTIGVRYDEEPGFDLTRATRAAILKYPWFRDPEVSHKKKKWSAYKSEQKDFEEARKFHSHERQTAEAALMDWADDIAYSIHDLEDFHRAGVIPWQRVFSRKGGQELIARTESQWFNAPADAEHRLTTAWRSLDSFFFTWDVLTEEQYDGSREHRVALRSLTSTLIGHYVQSTQLSADMNSHPLLKDPAIEAEIALLKQITKDYVITSPTLLAQQHGQKQIIVGLFKAIMDDKDEVPAFLPVRLRYLWKYCDGIKARFAADCISGLTETQATGLYSRLYGTAAGSVLDPIIR